MEEANSYLCKCKISEENLDKWEDESQKALIKEGIDPNGTITLNSCEKFKNLSGDQGDSAGASQDMDTIVKLFAAIEKMFSCTGICNGDIKYYFYDVNNGPPDDEDKKNEGCFM